MYFSGVNQQADFKEHRKKPDVSAYDGDGSSESDVDNEPIVSKKKARPVNPFSNQRGYNFGNVTGPLTPNTSFAETASLDVFKNKSKEFVEDKKKKGNQIWKDIAEEDMVTDVAASFFTGGSVRPDDRLQERGSEQYLNRRLRKRKLDDRSNFRTYESDSEVSSDGLSDDSLEFVRAKRGREIASVKKSTFTGGRAVSVPETFVPATKPKRYAVSGNSAEAVETETGNHSVPEVMKQPMCNDDSNINDVNNDSSYSKVDAASMDMDVQNEGKEPLDRVKKKWKDEIESRFKGLDDECFVRKMVQHLQEQRNPCIVLKAVSILGRESCLKLLHKTLKIKRYGGIIIKKKTRLRTTGGTFLYLIRNCKWISSDRKEAVLHDESPNQAMEVGGANYFDKPSKIPYTKGGGITQRILSRHGGMSHPKIDLESEKFSLPSNGVEEQEAVKQTSEKRTEISYNDLDLLDFEF